MTKKDKKEEIIIIENNDDNSVTIIGEESGGWSRKPNGPKSLTITMTKTKKPKDFGEISQNHPWNTRGTHNNNELKWVSSSDEVRMAVLADADKLDPDIFIITDEGVKDIENKERYKSLFGEITEEVFKNTNEENIELVMDDSDLMKPMTGMEKVKDIAERHPNKNIRYKQVDSEKYPVIQTQDMIAGAANKSRAGDSTFIDKVSKNIRQWIKR